jgi:hypothetical protein
VIARRRFPLQLETAQSELESYHARVARAAADEEAVLADSDLSEHEAIKRLGEAQKLQAIYSSRIAHREGVLKKLTVELEADLSAGGRQLTGLLNGRAGKARRARERGDPGFVRLGRYQSGRADRAGTVNYLAPGRFHQGDLRAAAQLLLPPGRTNRGGGGCPHRVI